MRLYEKAIIIYGTFIVTELGIGALILTTSLRSNAFAFILHLAPLFVLDRFARRHLVCPHCGKSAMQLPNLFVTPWVGGKCRYCGKDY